MPAVSQTTLILATALFLTATGNVTFFRHVVDVYPATLSNLPFLVSLAVVYAALLTFLLSLLSFKRSIKPVLIFFLLLSSLTGYFMQSYDIVIDKEMINNMMQTDFAESMDLLSVKMIASFALLGLLPSYVVYRVPLKEQSFRKALAARGILVASALGVLIVPMLLLGQHYASFFREHKPLRFYTNPLYALYSAGKFIGSSYKSADRPLQCVGADACIPPEDKDRELVILVVGEAARADHFALNGYGRATNPLLMQEEIINFTDMHSCGTSTAVSVPCMFSIFGRGDYDDGDAKSTENVLDVLKHAGVNILWRDNNSDSKGVALRVPYESFKTPETNPVCDVECRDEGMLHGLDAYIKEHKSGDILIVLHQMGNHGPAYYKRYPKSFEVFTPICATNELESCTQEEIINTYDNALRYTDHFLTQVINFLKPYSGEFETAMLYLADHGESLGENGLYLHGIPYMIAPDAQTRVGAFIWFGEGMKEEREQLEGKKARTYTQDHLFHTLLGLMEVDSEVYRADMDMVRAK